MLPFVSTALWLSFLFIAGWSATFRLRAFEADASIDDAPGEKHFVGLGPFRFTALEAPRPRVARSTRNALWAAFSAAAFGGASSLWQLLAAAHATTRELERSTLFRSRNYTTMDALLEHGTPAVIALVSLALSIALHRATVRYARRVYATA